MVKKVTEDDPLDFSGTEEGGKQVVYLLDVRIPDSPPQRIQVRGKLVMGQHENADVQIKGRGLLAKHAIFRIANGVLSMHNFSPETQLNGKELAPGRMYILDKGDKLVMGQLDIIIRRDEVEEHELETPKTNVKSILQYKDELEKNKQEQSAKRGFFGKLKALFTRNKANTSLSTKESDKKLPKQGHYKPKASTHPSPPGPILRAFGLPGTLGLIYLVLFGILPWQKMDALVFENAELTFLMQVLSQKISALMTLYPNFKNHLILLQELLSTQLLAFILAFMTLEVLSHLLAGSSFGHVLIGIETDDSFVIKRLKAIGRLFFWPLSCATVIGELLPIVGLRTLKEILTASHPYSKSAVRRFLGTFLIVPLVAILAPISALFLDPDFWEGPWQVSTPPVRQTPAGTVKLESLFFSAALELPKDPDLIILPLMNPEKAAESTLLLIDVKKNQQIRIKRAIPPAFSFAHFPLANPILPFLHPNISKNSPGDHLLHDTILGFAFSIRLDNYLDYTLEFGPFTYGLTKLRQQLKEQFHLQGRPEVFRLPTGKTDMWAIRESELKEQNHIFLWNLDQSFPSFILEHNQESAGFAISIVSKILRTMRFKKEMKIMEQTPITLPESTLFMMNYMLEPPNTETLADIQRVTAAMKMLKNAAVKTEAAGAVSKSWQEAKTFLHNRWKKLVPPKPKDKVAVKIWQKTLDEFNKL
ncbi:MAG: FHA domain-containing protein [Bdellovibrio sp.]|nr:FHA domain-containing protein [Bdellovibrio sp.]